MSGQLQAGFLFLVFVTKKEEKWNKSSLKIKTSLDIPKLVDMLIYTMIYDVVLWLM